MPDIIFDFRSTAAYIQSFAALRTSLSPRNRGRVIEIQAVFPSDELMLYMEAASLYLIGFQNAGGRIFGLHGDDQPFIAYLEDKFGKRTVIDSRIKAKYTRETWDLKMVKATLDQTLLLKTFAPGDTRITLAKQHVDRMAFAISEAARFMPIRCAVACVLHDDYKFLAVLERLANYSKQLVRQERKAESIQPGKVLSKRDANLRSAYPSGNIHVFEMSGNKFDGLSKTERWLQLLLGSDSDLTPDQRQRLRSLPVSHWHELTLGDFQDLVKNWSKLSASRDPYIHEIISEVHIREAAGATPEDETRFVLEWH